MRYQHTGAAQVTLLAAPMEASSLDPFLVADPAGYPAETFFVVIDKGTASEEKVLVRSRQGATFTPASRGADGTTPAAHGQGASVEHVFTAVEADDANRHIEAQVGVHGLPSTDSVAGRTYVDVRDAATLGAAQVFASQAVLLDRPQTYDDLQRPRA